MEMEVVIAMVVAKGVWSKGTTIIDHRVLSRAILTSWLVAWAGFFTDV
jgi:hypothetical protein